MSALYPVRSVIRRVASVCVFHQKARLGPQLPRTVRRASKSRIDTEPRKRRTAWRWPSFALHTRTRVWSAVLPDASPTRVPSRESTISKTGMPLEQGSALPGAGHAEEAEVAVAVRVAGADDVVGSGRAEQEDLAGPDPDPDVPVDDRLALEVGDGRRPGRAASSAGLSTVTGTAAAGAAAPASRAKAEAVAARTLVRFTIDLRVRTLGPRRHGMDGGLRGRRRDP